LLLIGKLVTKTVINYRAEHGDEQKQRIQGRDMKSSEDTIILRQKNHVHHSRPRTYHQESFISVTNNVSKKSSVSSESSDSSKESSDSSKEPSRITDATSVPYIYSLSKNPLDEDRDLELLRYVATYVHISTVMLLLLLLLLLIIIIIIITIIILLQ